MRCSAGSICTEKVVMRTLWGMRYFFWHGMRAAYVVWRTGGSREICIEKADAKGAGRMPAPLKCITILFLIFYAAGLVSYLTFNGCVFKNYIFSGPIDKTSI